MFYFFQEVKLLVIIENFMPSNYTWSVHSYTEEKKLKHSSKKGKILFALFIL